MKKTEENPKKPNLGWLLNGDRVAIKQDEAEKKTKGGIIIPDVAQSKEQRGTIVALGDECFYDLDTGERKRFCPWFEGQQVTYGKYAGSEIIGEDGEEYIIMRVHDISLYKPK